MKTIVFLISLTCCIGYSAYAQANELTKDTFLIEKIISIPGVPKDSLYKIVLYYLKSNPKDLFFTNDRIKKKKKEWALGRAKVFDKNDFKGPGFRATGAEQTLIADGIFCYQVGSDSPIQFLSLHADILIMFKDSKVRIVFYNIVYTHKNIGAPPMFKEIYGIGRSSCPMNGTYRELMNCPSSPKAIENIGYFFNASINSFINKVEYAALNPVPISQSLLDKKLNEDW